MTLRTLSLGILLGLGASLPARAATMASVPAVADTYVNSAKPNTRYGSATELKADAAPVRESYLRFTVSAIGAQEVQQAILRLTVASGSSSASDSGGALHLISSSGWSESSTTWNTNRPAVDGPLLATQGAVKPKQIVDFDVTSIVRRDATYNFALVTASGNGVRYRSREASTGRPQLLIFFVPGPREQPAGQVGWEDHVYGASAETSGNRMTGAKPESKLWYHAGFWWATLLAPATNTYSIHWLDVASQSWIDSGVFVDERARSRQDVLWDGEQLYVLSRFGGSAPENRLRRYAWVEGMWVADGGFPVTVPGGGTEAATIARDTTGTLWIAYTLGSRVYVSHSLGTDTAWSAPFVLPVPQGSEVSADDIAAVVALPGKIVVLWSNQLTEAFYAAVHLDGAAPGIWALEIAAAGARVADDHLNAKVAEGRVFVAVKTDRTGSSDTLVGLLVRATNGTWSPLHPVTTVPYAPTRPICLLDEGARRVYVFYSDLVSVRYKTSDLDVIGFPSGAGTPFIASSTTTDINNPTTTKQNVSAATGLVVLASSPGNSSYWHNTAGLSAPATAAAPTTSTTSPPSPSAPAPLLPPLLPDLPLDIPLGIAP